MIIDIKIFEGVLLAILILSLLLTIVGIFCQSIFMLMYFGGIYVLSAVVAKKYYKRKKTY